MDVMKYRNCFKLSFGIFLLIVSNNIVLAQNNTKADLEKTLDLKMQILDAKLELLDARLEYLKTTPLYLDEQVRKVDSLNNFMSEQSFDIVEVYEKRKNVSGLIQVIHQQVQIL